MKYILSIFFAATLLIIATGCSKKSETYSGPALNDYYPFQTGRAFIYRLDSTVPISFGQALTVHSYQEKDSIESTFTDNQGRLSYRIFRYRRDTAGTQPWQFMATSVATPTSSVVEYVDNNMRFIKLALPLRDGYSFPAHQYIDTRSQNTSVMYLADWQYEYRDVGQPKTIGSKTYNETLFVAQHDETSPPGPFDPNNFQTRDFSVEVYAKGIGLVYKEFLHSSYQTTPSRGYEASSYGVKLTLLSFH